MNTIRRQFLALLIAIVVLFAGTVVLDLQFFGQASRLYRLESEVASVLLDWTSLLDRTSGLLLSNEPIGQAYAKWKGEYDTYRARWPATATNLKRLAEGDGPLSDQITWVHKSLTLGLDQMEVVDLYLNHLLESLNKGSPEVVQRDSISNLGELSPSRDKLATVEAFYLSIVRNSVHLIDNMMGPVLDTAHTRFQGQIADRVSLITEHSSALRLVLIALLLVVLLAFLLRVWKLNRDLMAMVGQRTMELETVRRDQESRIVERTEELRAANESLRREIEERRAAEALVSKLNRLYATLSNVNQSLVWIHDTPRLLPEICRVSVEYGQFQFVWLGTMDRSLKRLDVHVARTASEGTTQTFDLDKIERAPGPTTEAVQTGRPVIHNDLTTDETFDSWLVGERPDYGSSATFPLLVKGQVVGLFGIYSDDRGYFGDDDIGLLSEMAKDISFALEFIEGEKKQQETERVLHQWNDELERGVRERTRELEEKNAELDRLNRLFVGREVRMTSLKERIRELEGPQGQ